MRIGVLGINHKSSELFFRELLAKACQRRITSESSIAERLCCVVLSTCNRTEIYFHAEDLAAAQSELLGILREEIGEPFEHKLYTYFGLDCFIHLAMVTSGLDSVILAETEIQRQVKMSYENASLYHSLPSCMHYLFQKSLKIGKQIRSTLVLPPCRTDLPRMLLQIGQMVFPRFVEKKILFVGNSEINRKVISYFKTKGLDQISLCTRSPFSASELRIALENWSELSRWREYDCIICGTNFPDYLIKHTDLDQSPIRESKLILDLSVPRNVDPLLLRHPLITLLNMEELGHLIEEKQHWNLLEINRAKETIEQMVERYLESFRFKTLSAACV